MRHDPIELPETAVRALAAMAERSRRTPSDLLRQAVEEFIAKQEELDSDWKRAWRKTDGMEKNRVENGAVRKDETEETWRKEWEKAVNQSFGIWRDRPDIEKEFREARQQIEERSKRHGWPSD